jgi:L-ascorbate metabolism protein UlaG (beta-lactamase superfamily)
MKTILAFVLLLLSFPVPAFAASFPVDRFPTAGGEIAITFIGHASLMLEHGGKVIHVDPWGNLADYAALPKADLILITHNHPDHLDPAAIAAASKKGTVVVASTSAGSRLTGATVLRNDEGAAFAGIPVRAVPAYNRMHKRPDGTPFHPKGEGNGYLLTLGDKRIYVAGDTEDGPEMKALAGVDIAFLPVNLPYTMSPEMLANAARMLLPKVFYPYHTGDTDMARVEAALAGIPGVEVRIRPMK